MKALASSLGIKRSLSAKSVTSSKDLPSSSSMPVLKKAGTDELDKHAVPYSSIPQSTSMPQTDHFKFSTPDASIFTPTEDVSMTAPIPGTPMRPGQPVPTNARLSTGTGATTTIRLITSPFSSRVPSPPRLTPYQTDFNIIMDSPGGENEGVRVWPASPALASEKIYPALPVEDMAFLGKVTTAIAGNTPAKPPAVTVTKPNGTPALPQMPRDGPKDVFSPMKVPGSAARGSVSRSQPFLFGSPLPQHRVSNHDFGKAAASLLQEMNKRLSEAGVQGIDNSILERKPGSVDVFGPTSVESQQRFEAVDRFAQVHEEAFDKMDSIATHYAARRGVAEPTSKKRKSNVLGHGPAPSVGKRKSSVASHTGTRVISNGVRRNMGLPGGFGEDDQGDIEEEETRDPGDRRSSKRIRVTDEPGVNKGVRVSLAPPVPNLSEEEREKEKRKEKEREVIKRKLDAQKARRRSSRARVSISGKTPAGE